MNSNHQVPQHKTIKCLGLEIDFPFEPYGIQRVMMNKLTLTLLNKEHSIIESPTGTGKTLVLLTSSLAWLRKSKKLGKPFLSTKLKQRIAEERSEKLKSKPCTCDQEIKKDVCLACEAAQAEKKFSEIFGDTDSADTDAFVTAKIKTKIPKIYYGTRTHKQITQVIRELNKTPYKRDLKMCILSSRERSCINSDVKDQPNRNDLCQELIKSKPTGSMAKQKKESGCPFYKDQMSVAQLFSYINDEYNDRAWDIEDAAKFGQNSCCCPYFGARSLQEQADITFSPYNYLLDPTIRRTLNINLSNAIVIFDEAHNIEDICRDSASFSIDSTQLTEIIEAINVITSSGQSNEALNYFRNLFLGLKIHLHNYYIPQSTENSYGGDLSERKIFNQEEMLEFLTSAHLGPKDLNDIKDNLRALRGDEDDGPGEKSGKSEKQDDLGFNQMQYITQLCITMEFMYLNNCRYINDFRGSVSKSLNNRSNTQRYNRNRTSNNQENAIVYEFRLMCMNPGIAFEKIHSLAWSVIVASGTLSPIESLKTELGCKFSNVLEGAHVIDRERIFSCILARGPRGIDLNCAYQHSLKLDFQDEVGLIVKDICLTVPNGVLCFFPSYDRMENFYQRWFYQKYIAEIQQRKTLFREQKNFTSARFEQELENYNQKARTKGGALLLAVFRGKVSEGIDFADDAARAVITIGIPYPNIKEVTVGLKRDYNDLERRSRPELMSGSNWYGSQAFRALNQALGRCIRHKEDWGAIMMIDSRLKYPDSMKNISRWLLNNMHTEGDYKVLKERLNEFVARRTSA